MISVAQISGTLREEGAEIALTYKMGKPNIELVETLINRNFPDEFHAIYETIGVHNIQKNIIIEIPDGHTKWISESEFQFFGL